MVGDEHPTAPPVASGPDAAQDDPFGGLRAGTRIGKYEIVEMLGQGGFGITYRARDSQLRRDVAIKEYLPTGFAMRQGGSMVLPRSTQTAEDFRWGRERFLDEARTLASLEDAAGIVNVYDFMEANGTAYMVMALVRGETLEARLKRDRRLPQPAIEQLLYPLLDGLEKVHEAGFLHRDIKPANILLDGHGRPTLIDFGASRVALQGRTQALTAVYTPGYAAFEQSTSAKQGPWTDIYALAATLYHGITGAPPTAASDRMIDDQLVPAAEAGKGRYAPSLLAAVDSGLKLKAIDRPQSIADWRRVLSGLMRADGDGPAGTPTREMDEPPTRRIPDPPPPLVNARHHGRRPGMWIVACGVLLALAGGAWWAFRPAPETSEESLRRIEAEAQRQTALARKLREEETARQQAAADARRKVEEEAARKAAEEKAAAEAATRRQAEQEASRKAAEEKAAADARRRTEEEAARKAAAEKAAAEAAARRQTQQDAARKAAEEKAAAEADAARRQREEEIRRDTEARIRAEYEARRQAEEQARAEAATRETAAADAKRRADEEARRSAEDKSKAEADGKRQAEAAEGALRLSETDRKRVQVALTALGHNTKGSDGSFGLRTRQMIGAWQRSQGATETGYLTAAQVASLRQLAAPALARFDEEQKRIEDDKRKAEDDARKRAEEERRAPPLASSPSMAAAPSTAAPTGPSAAPFDGTYQGDHCSAPRDMRVGCQPVSAVVQAGNGRYEFKIGRCNSVGTVTFKVDSSGSFTGMTSGLDETCRPNSGRIWGRISGNRLSVESGGTMRANLTRR